MRRLCAERLVLEPVTKANAATLWRLMSGGGLREFQDVPRYSPAEFERRVATRPKRFDARTAGRFEWLIFVAATREPVGWTSLRVGEPARGSAEIGYSIAAARRGCGYAREAVRALVDFAFTESDLGRVEACCVPGNVPSRRVLDGLGFAQLRVQRNGAIVRGRPVDVVQYEMLRERWGAKRTVYDERVSAAGA